MGRNHAGKGPWETKRGKTCPSRLSKYPAYSHRGASARSLNSLKVPFFCSKSRIIFVQGLLFLDKSLAFVQGLDCVRWFADPNKQEPIMRLSSGTYFCDTYPKSLPTASRLTCTLTISVTFPSVSIFLEYIPTPPQPSLVDSSSNHSAFSFISSHRLSFPMEQAGKTFFLA